MNKKESKNRTYVCPSIEIVCTGIEPLMVQGSGDHSTIGQGGIVGDAKRWNFSEDDDEQESSTDMNMWED